VVSSTVAISTHDARLPRPRSLDFVFLPLVCSKALSLAPEGVVKQPMEMEGRGATNQPVLAGEDEEASVVAESPHPDDEGRPRKDKRKWAPVSPASQARLLKPRGAAGARADEKEVTAVGCVPFS
jgi:hypothetical protein